MIFWRIAFALLIVEIITLAAVVGEVGFFATLGLWLLSVMIGGWLIREQGIATLARAQASLQQGAFPAGEMFESFCIFAAGALLIMPGFVGDVFAIMLLVPSMRNLLRFKGEKLFGFKQEPRKTYDDGVIDGVYERVPERTEQIAPKNQ